jgi:hypothetical protein
MEMFLAVALLATLIFIFSQSAIIFFLRKENQELISELENLKPPF